MKHRQHRASCGRKRDHHVYAHPGAAVSGLDMDLSAPILDQIPDHQPRLGFIHVWQ
jgi:hypothetical protein